MFSFYIHMLVVVIFVLGSNAYADQDCSCEKVAWKESFDNANHVIFGEVKEVSSHSDDLASAKFHPMEVFKGDMGFALKVVGSSKEGAGCMRVLEPGFYITYLTTAQNAVMHPCSHTRQLKPEEDLVPTLTNLKAYSDALGLEVVNPAVSKSGMDISSANSQQAEPALDKEWWEELRDDFLKWWNE